MAKQFGEDSPDNENGEQDTNNKSIVFYLRIAMWIISILVNIWAVSVYGFQGSIFYGVAMLTLFGVVHVSSAISSYQKAVTELEAKEARAYSSSEDEDAED